MIEEKILKTLKENPGCRVTTLASLVSESNVNMLDVIFKLEKEGKVYSKPHHDLANMQSYNKWYVKGE